MSAEEKIDFNKLKVELPKPGCFIDPIEIREKFNILCEILHQLENGDNDE